MTIELRNLRRNQLLYSRYDGYLSRVYAFNADGIHVQRNKETEGEKSERSTEKSEKVRVELFQRSSSSYLRGVPMTEGRIEDSRLETSFSHCLDQQRGVKEIERGAINWYNKKKTIYTVGN